MLLRRLDQMVLRMIPYGCVSSACVYQHINIFPDKRCSYRIPYKQGYNTYKLYNNSRSSSSSTHARAHTHTHTHTHTCTHSHKIQLLEDVKSVLSLDCSETSQETLDACICVCSLLQKNADLLKAVFWDLVAVLMPFVAMHAGMYRVCV
jgi:hypothetical protein